MLLPTKGFSESYILGVPDKILPHRIFDIDGLVWFVTLRLGRGTSMRPKLGDIWNLKRVPARLRWPSTSVRYANPMVQQLRRVNFSFPWKTKLSGSFIARLVGNSGQ